MLKHRQMMFIIIILLETKKLLHQKNKKQLPLFTTLIKQLISFMVKNSQCNLTIAKILKTHKDKQEILNYICQL